MECLIFGRTYGYVLLLVAEACQKILLRCMLYNLGENQNNPFYPAILGDIPLLCIAAL